MKPQQKLGNRGVWLIHFKLISMNLPMKLLHMFTSHFDAAT
jgi:hypothetical protein